MPDKKVAPSGRTDFHISKHPDNNNGKDILVRLASADKYDLYQKDLPAGLPAEFIWVNNFGLKLRHADKNNPGHNLDSAENDKYPDSVDEYTIELDDVPNHEPVYYYNKQVNRFAQGKTNIGNGRVHVKLGLGDPPIGWPKPSA